MLNWLHSSHFTGLDIGVKVTVVTEVTGSIYSKFLLLPSEISELLVCVTPVTSVTGLSVSSSFLRAIPW